ncbi:MAG: phospholipase D-like domain-containing protein [Saprospiraceae bacterium]|nr:phospholipase D-like domain-containing protein [Saprospiraceae bacterium]MDW8228841.1 phospholipase D-like domain-containing protein [Saprospiraceae bacterium]
MKILSNPWRDEFLRLVGSAKTSIKIAAPFVKQEGCEAMLQAKRSTSAICLVTNFQLKSIFCGSIDLSALETILDNRGTVRSFPKLHAKIYLSDDAEAVVTSANLTHGGLFSNFEYGLYVSEPEVVAQIAADFERLLADERTGSVDKAHLETAREILSKLPEPGELAQILLDRQAPEESPDVLDISAVRIEQALTGWRLEVFKCVNAIPGQVFTLSDVYAFEGILRGKYPENQHITDKIRQQLQGLRDVGLLEFLGGGRYRKLWR